MFLGYHFRNGEEVEVRLKSRDELLEEGWQTVVGLAGSTLQHGPYVIDINLIPFLGSVVRGSFVGNNHRMRFNGMEIVESICHEVLNPPAEQNPDNIPTENFMYYLRQEIQVEIKTFHEFIQNYNLDTNNNFVPSSSNSDILTHDGRQIQNYLGGSYPAIVERDGIYIVGDQSYRFNFVDVKRILNTDRINFTFFGSGHPLTCKLKTFNELRDSGWNPDPSGGNLLSPNNSSRYEIRFFENLFGEFLDVMVANDRTVYYDSLSNGSRITIPADFIKQIEHYKGEPLPQKKKKKPLKKEVKSRTIVLPSNGYKLIVKSNGCMSLGGKNYNRSDTLTILKELAIENDYLDLELVE